MVIFVLVLAGLILGIVYGYPYYSAARDRSAMRERLRGMGVARWSNTCPGDAYISFVFTGSSSHYYRLHIPPGEVDEFLEAVQGSTHKVAPQPVERFPGSSDRVGDWWKPEAEPDLVLVELRGQDAGGHSYPLWYVAGSRTSGNVYLHFQGH